MQWTLSIEKLEKMDIVRPQLGENHELQVMNELPSTISKVINNRKYPMIEENHEWRHKRSTFESNYRSEKKLTMHNLA